MIPPSFSPIRVAFRPGRTPGAGGIVPALWLGACLCTAGCGLESYTNAYGGTASLEGSPGATSALAHQSIAIMSCRLPAQMASVRQTYEEAERFSVLTIGDQCSIDGAWSGGTFLAQPGSQCVIPFADKAITIRVTDAFARRTLIGERHGVVVDDTYVEVQIGGDTVEAQGPSEHVRYDFSGTILNTVDASGPCLEAHERRRAAGVSSS